jgi:hypothetical protein
MYVVRIHKAICSFNELMRDGSESLRKEVVSKLSCQERGHHFVQAPLTRMKGTRSRLGDLYLDTELLLRYTRMSLQARRLLVRSIWRALDKAEVDALETELPWGETTMRQIMVTRSTFEDTRTFNLWIAMPKK